jgi:hypothetical protein
MNLQVTDVASTTQSVHVEDFAKVVTVPKIYKRTAHVPTTKSPRPAHMQWGYDPNEEIRHCSGIVADHSTLTLNVPGRMTELIDWQLTIVALSWVSTALECKCCHIQNSNGRGSRIHSYTEPSAPPLKRMKIVVLDNRGCLNASGSNDADLNVKLWFCKRSIGDLCLRQHKRCPMARCWASTFSKTWKNKQ